MTLFVFHIDLNIYAFVGLIMLIGLVEKNATCRSISPWKPSASAA
jgi:multidrug efflux pump subunit AcrB